MKLSATAVYTTILPKTVFAASHGEDVSEPMSEKKRWVSAQRQFLSAQKKGLAYPVLFSDARHCAALVFWAIIVDMKVSDTGTSYTFRRLNGLRDCYTQDLALCSEKRNIAPYFIRPYALVLTPDFLEAATIDAKLRLDEQEQPDVVDVDWKRNELVQGLSLELGDDWAYFLDTDGDISRRPLIRRRGQAPEKALLLGIKRQAGFYYNLGDDDDPLGVYRAPIVTGTQDHV